MSELFLNKTFQDMCLTIVVVVLLALIIRVITSSLGLGKNAAKKNYTKGVKIYKKVLSLKEGIEKDEDKEKSLTTLLKIRFECRSLLSSSEEKLSEKGEDLDLSTLISKTKDVISSFSSLEENIKKGDKERSIKSVDKTLSLLKEAQDVMLYIKGQLPTPKGVSL